MFWSLNREKWATMALQIFCIYSLLSLHTFTAALMVGKTHLLKHYISLLFFFSLDALDLSHLKRMITFSQGFAAWCSFTGK